MKNKTLGIGILSAIGLATLTLVFEPLLGYETADNLYAIAGLMMLFFGIWGAINLIKE